MSSRSDDALRAELKEACVNVRQQIAAQRFSEPIPGVNQDGNMDTGSASVIRDLQSELDQLEDALARLG